MTRGLRVVAVLTALVLVVVALRLLIFDVAQLGGRDMWPSLGPGAWVVANRHATPGRGDVVLIERTSGAFAVARVLGLPGETVAVLGGRVRVGDETATRDEVGTIAASTHRMAVARETVRGLPVLVVDDPRRSRRDLPARRLKDAAEDGGPEWLVLPDHREHGAEPGLVSRDLVRGVVVWTIAQGDVPQVVPVAR